MPSVGRVVSSLVKQVVWACGWIVWNTNEIQLLVVPNRSRQSRYRMALTSFLFAWIFCDIQSTYPIVVSVGPWLIDCSSALLRAQLRSDRIETDE